jgi:hypothetical protein
MKGGEHGKSIPPSVMIALRGTWSATCLETRSRVEIDGDLNEKTARAALIAFYSRGISPEELMDNG